MLDTDHLSLNQRGHPKIRERLTLIPADEIAITIITAEEQLRGRLAQLGKATSGHARSTAYLYLRKAILGLAKLNILDYDASSESIYQGLKLQRIRAGSQDLRIAAITLANNGTLVTGNRSDFAKVSGLMLEDWTI
ncbi:MAG: type II toxin-antitoxin system VapC family toxin [Acidobacteriota bacterium]